MGLSSSAFHIFGPLFAYFWSTLFASFAFIRSTLQYGKISTLCIWMPSAFILMAVSHHILSSRKRAVKYATIHFSDTSRCSLKKQFWKMFSEYQEEGFFTFDPYLSLQALIKCSQSKGLKTDVVMWKHIIYCKWPLLKSICSNCSNWPTCRSW